jgi:hypothetical protein
VCLVFSIKFIIYQKKKKMLSHEGDVLKSRFGDAVAMEVSFDDWMTNFRHDFGGIQVYC